jgi:hypothetical protein
MEAMPDPSPNDSAEKTGNSTEMTDSPEGKVVSGKDTPKAADGPKALTKEEQLALYEEDLKEHDWGHQPC